MLLYRKNKVDFLGGQQPNMPFPEQQDFDIPVGDNARVNNLEKGLDALKEENDNESNRCYKSISGVKGGLTILPLFCF